jgi:hypothetical protein
MFSILVVAASGRTAELDAAQGYASIYGSADASSALASIHMPSVPWG